MTGEGPALRLEGLSRGFGEETAVDGLDFEVRSGELFGLVGPDGAGKTTTLRMLAGVLRPTTGDARVLGISVVRRPEAVKDRIAYMSQRFGLYTDLTVLENLRFYADLYRVPAEEWRRRLDRLFEFSGLGPFRARLAGNLSGGMKQKLGLSCALIHRPDLMLLDEPTFGVDPVSRRDLWLIVHEMVDQGVTAVVSTAYLDEAERFDRLALLHRGRLAALDTPAALQGRLEDRVLEVVGPRPRRIREVARGLEGVLHATAFGDRVHLVVDSPEREPEAVARGLEEAGLGEIEVRRVQASLEDVFITEVQAEDRETEGEAA